MGEEIKVVTRQETFNDLAVRELAKSRSACVCKIQFGRCDKTECAHCHIGQQYKNCYNQMTEYDRQRLSSYVAEQYAIDSRHPEGWMTHKHYVTYMLGIILAMLVFGILVILTVGMVLPGAGPDKDPPVPYDLDNKIIATIKATQQVVHDVNKDGEVNCIDYTTTFKILWDIHYPELKNNCLIVRNKGPGMHHLFIHIWYKGSHQIEIEPWARNPYRYTMQDNWTDIYDPKNNIYGETSRWLKEVKDGY